MLWASAWGFFYILDFEKVASPENPGLGGTFRYPTLFALLRPLCGTFGWGGLALGGGDGGVLGLFTLVFGYLG